MQQRSVPDACSWTLTAWPPICSYRCIQDGPKGWTPNSLQQGSAKSGSRAKSGPASSIDPARGGSPCSFILNPARVLPPKLAPKDAERSLSLTLTVDDDWLSYTLCRVDADWLPPPLHFGRSVTSPVTLVLFGEVWTKNSRTYKAENWCSLS